MRFSPGCCCGCTKLDRALANPNFILEVEDDFLGGGVHAEFARPPWIYSAPGPGIPAANVAKFYETAQDEARVFKIFLDQADDPDLTDSHSGGAYQTFQYDETRLLLYARLVEPIGPPGRFVYPLFGIFIGNTVAVLAESNPNSLGYSISQVLPDGRILGGGPGRIAQAPPYRPGDVLSLATTPFADTSLRITACVNNRPIYTSLFPITPLAFTVNVGLVCENGGRWDDFFFFQELPAGP